MDSIVTKTALFLFLWVPLASTAGSFNVNPIRLEFDPSTKTATLKVTNEDAEKVTVQLEAKAWSQDVKGSDQYADTEDLIFFPKIVDIEAGNERLVRVGYTGPSVGNQEKTYRLFVQELPVSKAGEVAMKFAIRMGIPVFVQVKTPQKTPVITNAEVKNGAVLVTMGNKGNSHYVVDKIAAKGINAKGETVFSHDTGGWYVLAGQQHIFPVNIPPAECVKAASVAIEVKVDKQTLTKTIDVSPVLCQPEPKSSPLEKTKGR